MACPLGRWFSAWVGACACVAGMGYCMMLAGALVFDSPSAAHCTLARARNSPSTVHTHAGVTTVAVACTVTSCFACRESKTQAVPQRGGRLERRRCVRRTPNHCVPVPAMLSTNHRKQCSTKTVCVDVLMLAIYQRMGSYPHSLTVCKPLCDMGADGCSSVLLRQSGIGQPGPADSGWHRNHPRTRRGNNTGEQLKAVRACS